MGSGGVAIAALPTVICLKVPFSDGLGGIKTRKQYAPKGQKHIAQGSALGKYVQH